MGVVVSGMFTIAVGLFIIVMGILTIAQGQKQAARIYGINAVKQLLLEKVLAKESFGLLLLPPPEGKGPYWGPFLWFKEDGTFVLVDHEGILKNSEPKNEQAGGNDELRR